MNLELMALRWLLYEKRCEIALRERSPRMWSCGRPDVLGITPSRYLIEIEIKRSASDFRADQQKPSRTAVVRKGLADKLPKQFYYLVPRELVHRVEAILPPWAGLLRGPTADSYSLGVVVKAPNNTESRRLSVKECCQLVRNVANWAMSEAELHASAYRNFTEGHWPYPEPDYEI